MKERIVELLVHIMLEVQTKRTLADIDLGELKNKGYTQTEISEALSWLHNNLKVHDGVATLLPDSMRGTTRIFHEVEKAAFTIESQGYLIQLRALGLLDDRDLEIVIDRAMQTGYEKLSVDEVREIVAPLLMGKMGNASLSSLNTREHAH
jgi:uncharacterized protein Smg (DUF494 family)